MLGFNFTSKAVVFDGLPLKSTNVFSSAKILLLDWDNFYESKLIFIVLSKNCSVNDKYNS
jgi:hypothetical protein